MTRQSVHIVVGAFDDGYDGVAQWIEDNKVKTRRLDQAPAQLKKFFAKFKYVFLSEEVRKQLRLPHTTYFARDFVPALLERRR